MTNLPVPVKIGEHTMGPGGMCTWCFKRFPCWTFMRQFLAYFWHRPSDMVPFMRLIFEKAKADPALGHIAADILWQRLTGWIPAALDAQRQLERARDATRSVVSRINGYAKDIVAGHITPSRGSPWIYHGYRIPAWLPPDVPVGSLNQRRHVRRHAA